MERINIHVLRKVKRKAAVMDENTELRIILNHYFNDTHFTECLLNDNCTETGGAENDTLDATAGLSPPSLPQYFYILVILIYILIFLAGILGNSLVIWAVARRKELWSPRNIFILNLAVSDICKCSLADSIFPTYVLGFIACPFAFRWISPPSIS